MIFAVKAVTGQNLSYQSPQNNDNFSFRLTYQNSSKVNTHQAFNKTGNKKFIPEKTGIKPVLLLNPVSCSLIAADYYTQGFGFFCKKELKFEKATKIPLRFRLGTLQYNDYLEGKPNAGILSPQ